MVSTEFAYVSELTDETMHVVYAWTVECWAGYEGVPGGRLEKWFFRPDTCLFS